MEQYRYYGRNMGMQNQTAAFYDNRRNPVSCVSHDNCGCDSSKTNQRDNCSCDDKPIGMAYVPVQIWKKLYTPDNALFQGTAFPSLNLVFCGVRGKM